MQLGAAAAGAWRLELPVARYDAAWRRGSVQFGLT